MASEVYEMIIKDDIMASWNSIRLAENLATDADTIKFLVHLYIRSKRKGVERSEVLCCHCRSHLVLICTNCNFSLLPVPRAQSAGEDVPLQVQGAPHLQQTVPSEHSSMMQVEPPAHTQAVFQHLPQSETESFKPEDRSLQQASTVQPAQGVILQHVLPLVETEYSHEDPSSLQSLPLNEIKSVHEERSSLQQAPVVQHAQDVLLQQVLPQHETDYVCEDPSVQTLSLNETKHMHEEDQSLQQASAVHAQGVLLQEVLPLHEMEYSQDDSSVQTLSQSETKSPHEEDPSLQQASAVQHVQGVLSEEALLLHEMEYSDEDPSLQTLSQNKMKSMHEENPSLQQVSAEQHAQEGLLLHEMVCSNEDPSLQTLPQNQPESVQEAPATQHNQGVLLREILPLHEMEHSHEDPSLQHLSQNETESTHEEYPSLQEASAVYQAQGVHPQGLLQLYKTKSSYETPYNLQTASTLQQTPSLPEAHSLQQVPVLLQVPPLQGAPVLQQDLCMYVLSPPQIPHQQETLPLLVGSSPQKNVSTQNSLHQQPLSSIDSFLKNLEMKGDVDWGLQVKDIIEDVQTLPFCEDKEMDHENEGGRFQSNKDVDDASRAMEDTGSDIFQKKEGGESSSFKNNGVSLNREAPVSEITERAPHPCNCDAIKTNSDQGSSLIQVGSLAVKRSRSGRVLVPKSDPLFVDETKKKSCAGLYSRGRQSPKKQSVKPCSRTDPSLNPKAFKHSQKMLAMLRNQFQIEKDLKVSLVRCDDNLNEKNNGICEESATVSKDQEKKQDHINKGWNPCQSLTREGNVQSRSARGKCVSAVSESARGKDSKQLTVKAKINSVPMAAHNMHTNEEDTGGHILLEGNGAVLQTSMKIGDKSLGITGQPADVLVREKQTGSSKVPSSMFVCTHCQQAFTQESVLVRHIQAHNLQNNPSELDSSKSEEPNEAPSKKDPSHLLICKKCGKSCKTKSTLYSHMRSHTKPEDCFECDTCGQSFLQESSIVHHKKRAHAANAALQCRQCDFQCATRKDMKRHMRKTHWKQTTMQCEFCGVQLVRQAFEAHLLLHKGEKPFPCNKCELTFRTPAQLNTHMKAYHGEVERPFRCDQCGHGFIKAQTLREHMSRHSGEKPYKCPQCPSSFVRKDYLNKHMRVHTGDKPYSCDICDQKFTFVSSLNRHKKKAHDSGNQETEKDFEVMVVPAETFELLQAGYLLPVLPENVTDVVYTSGSTLDT